MKFLLANIIAPNGTPYFAASHLGLFCLSMSHKKDARLIWVKFQLRHDDIKKPTTSGPVNAHLILEHL